MPPDLLEGGLALPMSRDLLEGGLALPMFRDLLGIRVQDGEPNNNQPLPLVMYRPIRPMELQLRRMEEYVRSLDTKHTNESRRHFREQINMADVCYRRIEDLGDYAETLTYGPFRYYRVKLLQYFVERVKNFIQCYIRGDICPAHTLREISLVLKMFDIYANFGEPTPDERNHVEAIRRLVKSESLADEYKLTEIKDENHEFSMGIRFTEDSPGFTCCIYLPSNPEKYMRVFIRLLLFSRWIDPDRLVEMFQLEFGHIQYYLKCYPDENKTMEIFNRVASRLLVCMDMSSADRVEAARSLFDQPIPNYDMSGAEERANALKRVYMYILENPRYSSGHVITSVAGEPDMPDVWRGMIRDFWQLKRDLEGNEIFHLDLPNYFRDVAVFILSDIGNVGTDEAMNMMEELAVFCYNLICLENTALRVDFPKSMSTLNGYRSIMDSLGEDDMRFKLYALSNFCLEQKYDLGV